MPDRTTEEHQKDHLAKLLGEETNPETDVSRETLPSEPALQPEPQTSPDPGPEPKTVPLSALEAERKKWQAKVEEINQQNRTIQEQVAALQQQQKPQEHVEQVPDPEQDPVGYFMWEGKQRDKAIKDVQQTQREHAEYMQAYQQMQALDNAFAVSAQAYRQQHSDFDAAHKFFLDSQRQKAQLLGFEPQQVDQMVGQTVLQTVMQAQRSGQDVADVFYQLAKMSGYQGPQTPTPETPPMTQPTEPPMDKETFQRIQQGQRATGLQTTGTAPKRTGMTPEDVAAKPQDWFDRNMDMETFRRLMSEGSINGL